MHASKKQTSQQKDKEESVKNSVEMAGSEGNKEDKLPPGFRFHPTDEELITFYLINKISDATFTGRAIGDVDLNKCEPWELPAKAKMGEKEWYFFNLRDRKYPTGVRTNRATNTGYWKTTGKDKEIFNSVTSELVGMKKTLVFYRGRAPRGEKTNWVMHEYRIHSKSAYRTSKDEWVVCRVFQKSGGPKKYPTTNPSRNALMNPYALDPHSHSHSHHLHQIMTPQTMLQHHHPSQIMTLVGDPTTQFLFTPRPSSSSSNNPYTLILPNPLQGPGPDLASSAQFGYGGAGSGCSLALSGLNLNLAGGPALRSAGPHHHEMNIAAAGASLSGSFSGLDHAATTNNNNNNNNATTTASTTGYGTDMNSHNNVGNNNATNSGHANSRSSYVNVDNCMDLDSYWPDY